MPTEPTDDAWSADDPLPKPAQRALYAALAAMPYSGLVQGEALKATTTRDVLVTLQTIGTAARDAATFARQTEAELQRLHNDLAAVRRVLGLPTGDT